MKTPTPLCHPVAGALAVVTLVAAGSPALAKPLYITVPRAFSSAEPVTVDVAFGGTEAVELRVTKPDSLDAFVAQQSNLRRAYAEPPTQLNPGRYLSLGLNALRSPGSFLRFSIDPELRKELVPTLPDAPEESQAVSSLQEGPPKLVGLPPGTHLVRSEWLNLDLGGDARAFNVPGFGYSGDSGFQERRIQLKPLPPGVYILQLVQDRVEGQVTLVVTDLTAQVKQTDGEILVRVADRSQKPVANAVVAVHLQNGSKGPTGSTDRNGEIRLSVNDPRILVTVKRGEDVAVVDTDFYTTLAVAPDVFIYSDRPIYKPGDLVRFRGVVRKPSSYLAQLFLPRASAVRVGLMKDETTVASTGLEVDEFGSFAGNVRVPEDADAGVVRLQATLDGRPYRSEARVQAYVKPTFYLEITTDQDSVSPGDTITATVKARRYAGGVPADTGYEVFLYRSVLETPAWVDDSGMGGQGSAVTYGTASTTEGGLSVPKRLYSSVEQRGNAGTLDYADPWASAPRFNEKGEAQIQVTVPPLEAGEERFPFKFTLTVRSQDQEGTSASATRGFFFGSCDVLGQIAFAPKLVAQGGEASLAVRAVTLAGRPMAEITGKAEIVVVRADGSESSVAALDVKTAEDGVWRTPVKASKPGTLVARVTLTDKRGRTWEGESHMLVISDDGQAVVRVPTLSAEALGGVVEPGGTAKLVALFPENWGPDGGDSGPVWVTLSGNGIYDTKLLDISGLTLVHSFDVEKRFGSAVYASIAYPSAIGRWEERTVAFRIIPAERTLKVVVKPQLEEVQPLTPQTLRLHVENHAGEGVKAQVSVGVVDKAIYALQAEFRPTILDFFYPLGRNNVANFYSAEFQGYGYGEYLARLFGRTRAHEFAAIKPPTKKAKEKDQDTAYWNAKVLTDSQGNATVTFDMPSNQTLWVVTAVAADAEGRFGEGQAEFASRGNFTLAASTPQFLRAGDVADASVRVARAKPDKGKPNMAPLRLGIEVDGAIAVRKSDAPPVAPGEEVVTVVPLKTEREGLVSVRLALAGDDKTLRDTRDIPVRPSAVMEEMVLTSVGGGTLEIPKIPGATVASAEVRLAPSSVAAALVAVQDLLLYPHGCLEQLVATTVPNIAVHRTLEKIGALAKLDPESRALLALAQSRAAQGIQRILDLSVKSGGFTLWPGYDTPSFSSTLIALDGLAYAVEAKLVPAEDPRIVAAANYVAGVDGLPFPIDATRTYVLARLEGDKQAARVRALIESAPEADIYSVAMAVLAAHYAGIAAEPALRDKLASLTKASRDNMVRTADYSFDRDIFFSYPLRQHGLYALASHAASFGELDEAAARRELLAVLTAGESLSTFERSTALLHGLWLIERDAKAMRQATPPTIKAKGGKNPTLAAMGAGLVAPLDRDTTAVEVAAFDGVASMRVKMQVPLSAVMPTENGMSIARRYYVLREGGRVQLQPGDSVRQGEYIFVELELDAHADGPAGALRSAYYFVEDAVPAGFTPVQEDKSFRAAPYNLPLAHEAMKSRTFNTENVRFYFEEPAWWSQTPRKVGYVLRAQFPGTFAAPPATVADMYAPTIKARTAAASLRIEASGKGL